MLRVKYVANCSREYSAEILKYFVWHIVAMQEFLDLMYDMGMHFAAASIKTTSTNCIVAAVAACDGRRDAEPLIVVLVGRSLSCVIQYFPSLRVVYSATLRPGRRYICKHNA